MIHLIIISSEDGMSKYLDKQGTELRAKHQLVHYFNKTPK
jgi:hypothetical protein